jgi:DNA-binding transcriptional LysR family regulator
MDRLTCLQMFAEVARSSSFTAAAARLAVSRASVTKHVAWLERSLGAQLLKRTTKQVGLTDAGLRVLENGLLLLERYEEMGADVRDSNAEPRGVVRVGTPPSFGTHHLLPLLTSFSNRYPDIQVALALDDGRSNLVAEGLDVSVRISSALQDASHVALPLVKAPQMLVASPAYLKRAGAPRSVQDLARHNCLVHTLKAPTHNWSFNGPAGEVSIRVKGTICSNFGEALQQAALLGHGLSIHPVYMVAADVDAGRLVNVLPAFVPAQLDVFAIYSSRRNLPNRVQLFLQHLKDWARTPPDWAAPYAPEAPPQVKGKPYARASPHPSQAPALPAAGRL